jgi:hypothetical protein
MCQKIHRRSNSFIVSILDDITSTATSLAFGPVQSLSQGNWWDAGAVVPGITEPNRAGSWLGDGERKAPAVVAGGELRGG